MLVPGNIMGLLELEQLVLLQTWGVNMLADLTVVDAERILDQAAVLLLRINFWRNRNAKNISTNTNAAMY